jgi:hypothetical protein
MSLMKKCIFFFFAIFYTIVYGQSTIPIHSEMVFLLVEEVPQKRIPKGAELLEFAYQYDPAILYFGYHQSETTFKVLGKFTEEVEGFNQAKSRAYYKNDTIYLWSQYPFRASEINYVLVWKGNSINMVSVDYADPSEESIALAEAALKEGKIKEAIEYYYSVQYPSSYMNEDRVGLEILARANTLSLLAGNKKDYRSAIQYFQEAMEYYSLENLRNATDETSLNLIFEDNYLEEYKDSFGLWMGNYGYYLYKGDSLQSSVELNEWINQTYPQLSGPYLQKADALYDLKKPKEAKSAYITYSQLMKEKGKEKNIPSRVLDRIK